MGDVEKQLQSIDDNEITFAFNPGGGPLHRMGSRGWQVFHRFLFVAVCFRVYLRARLQLIARAGTNLSKMPDEI